MPPRLFRSLCFVPGNNSRFLEKARYLRADIVCLDLEDSVPNEQKDQARQMIRQAVRDRESYAANAVYIRTNSPASGLVPSDLRAVVRRGVDGIVIPKLNNTSELEKIIKILEDLERQRNLLPIGIMPSIESAEGVVHAYAIASSGGSRHSRIDCLVFGVFDLLADMGIEYTVQSDAAKYARARVALDAHAAGIPAIDGIWQDLTDAKGMEDDCLYGRSLGYAGKSVIHPDQIDVVHRLFHPTASEVAWAQKVVSAYELSVQSGRGATTVEGRMIDEVHYKQAVAVLEIAKTGGGSR